MSQILSTYDNNVACPLHVHEESDLNNLDKIAGKRIKWLCESSGNLLVFPRDLGEYGDQIGDGVIFETDGDKLYTNNIMGFIGIGDTQLKIGSRFDQGRDDLFMQYMLERVFSINMLDLQYSFNQDIIFDFMLFLFPYFLKKALGQGIYKSYRTFERNDMKLRGVLDVSRHIRLNIPITTAVAYRTREQTYDNEITQLIRHTIEYIRKSQYASAILSNDDETKACVAQIVAATTTYQSRDRLTIINKNLRPNIHPYYSEYEPLRRLCLQILRHEEIKYGEEKERVYGVIFDGAWLWEEYLATILVPLGIRHPMNKIGTGGFSLFTNNKAWRFPDFIGDGIVLDAKYKQYGKTAVWDINREDLAQVISYMYVEQARLGAILCPGNQDLASSEAELRGYGHKMVRLALPISKQSAYREFREEMLVNETTFANYIRNL